MAAADAPKIQQGEPVALVLGAGGARGFAQIGVIEALEARGLHVVAIAGSSSGALVGGLYAAGRLPDFRKWLLGLSRTAMLRMLDPVFGQPSLFGGERLIQALREQAGNHRIEQLAIPFTAVAVDLMRQREVWLRDGDLWDAVRASIAIPGIFTPHVVRGRALVDGGLLAPLPIAATRLSGAHRLIAVDMHSWPDRPVGRLATGGVGDAIRQGNGNTAGASEVLMDAPATDPGAGHEAERSWITTWLARRFRDEARRQAPSSTLASIGLPGPLGFTELMARSLDTMQAQIARVQMALDPPELVIRIPRDACQFYEFWRASELIDIGRREADKVLDAAGY
jgi:NTE family protein